MKLQSTAVDATVQIIETTSPKQGILWSIPKRLWQTCKLFCSLNVMIKLSINFV